MHKRAAGHALERQERAVASRRKIRQRIKRRGERQMQPDGRALFF